MDVIGRGAELGLIATALGHAGAGDPAVVWVQGEAGSGKTTLVDAAVADFLASGDGAARVVWRVTADAEEQGIENGVCDQLLRLAGTAADPSAEPGSRAASFLTSLHASAQEATVLVALDDLHWCDHASRQMLRFLLRRIDGMGVAFLLAHRPMGGWPAEVRHATEQHSTTAVALTGLAVGDVRNLMAGRGIPLTPRAGQRLHEHTGGNPLLLTMLAEELSPEELASGEGPLRAPRSVSEWVRQSYDAASAPVRAVVGAVAVLGQPTGLAELAELTRLPRPEAAVDEAIEKRLLRLVPRGAGRAVDVEHALVRSAVNETMGFEDFSTFNARAAELTQEPQKAMRHRLMASAGFEPELAAEAIALAEACAGEGALLASARLLALVGNIIPAGQGRCEVWVRAAERLLVIGELRWAEMLLVDVAAVRSGGPTAQELLVWGHLALQQGTTDKARDSANRAWEMGGDPRVAVGAAELLAYLGMDSGDGEAAVTWAARAIEAADDKLVAVQWAGTVLASGWALRGDLRPARELLEHHSLRLAGSASEPDIRLGHALTLLWSGRLGEASETLEPLRMRLVDGSAVLRATVRLAVAELGYRQGRWDDVLATTDSELAQIDEGWESRTAPMTLSVGAYVCAARGHDRRAAAFIARAESLLEAGANLPARTMVAIAKGRLATAQGRWGDVVAALEHLNTGEPTSAIPEGVHAWRADLAEALVAMGRLDAARDLLAEVDNIDGDPHATSGMLRARAALAVSRGQTSRAQEHLEEAVAPGEEVSGAYVHARALLALGSLLRRRGQRRRGADALEQALGVFTGLGAEPAARLARREVELCALRRSPQDPSALTPAEETVARLAVAGHTNREIANSLTVSIKTVETHLGRVFGKLGVRSRVELVAALAARGPQA